VNAVVLGAEGRLRVENWPRPAIGERELLIRVRGCGLCGSDIAKILALGPRVPAVLGHEVVGEVVEIGPGASGFALGDRVVVAHHVPCGTCHYCTRGSASMCRAFKTSNLDPGGFAEYVRVPAPNVVHATFRLPAGLADEAASFMEPLACCLRAVRRAGVRPGDTTVIAGLGSIGCLFVALGKGAGASVVGVDPIAERRDLARHLGADATGVAATVTPSVLERSSGRGADQVIITGGGTEALTWAASMVRDGGTVHVFAGGPGDVLPMPLDTLYHRELTITATYSSSPADLAEAFRLLASGEVVVERLITHRLPLHRLADGVDLMRRREAMKVFVTP
jgi:L-iditol 2-dehydrogenase